VRKGARGTQGRQGRSLTRDCMLNLLEGLTGGAKPRNVLCPQYTICSSCRSMPTNVILTYGMYPKDDDACEVCVLFGNPEVVGLVTYKNEPWYAA
jgi:hypothetical protein